MAGLFGDNFSPSLGWLSQLLQNQAPADIMNPQIYGNVGRDVSSGPSPLNPMSWRFPSIDNVLTGMLNGPGGAPAQAQSQAPSMPPLDPARNVGLAPGMNAPSAPPQMGLDQRAYAQAPAPQAAPQIPPQAAQSFAQLQQQQPDFLQGVSNFSHNLGSSGGLGGVIDAFRGIQTGKRYDPVGKAEQNQQNVAQAVFQSLVSQGYSPQEAYGMATASASDSKVAEKVLGEAYARPKTMEEFIAREAANRQRGTPGQASQSPVSAYEDFLRAKNRGEKAGTVEGERVVNAQLDLPMAVAQANETLRLTDELKAHKGREGNAWWHTKAGAYLPDASIPGNTDARDALGILNSIKGGAFLEAFKTLKGGGQITEVEGKKATDALNRMDRSQSKAEFDRALSDFQGIVKLGVDRANQLAGRQAPGGFQGNSGWTQVSPGVRIRQVQ